MAEPQGELALRTLAMPADTNQHGRIFGGWLLSQMDIAGAMVANKAISAKTVTVAIDAMKFHEPVDVGDVVCCYGKIMKIGNTSVTVKVEAWVLRQFSGERFKVTEGVFTYVHIDDDGRPTPIKSKPPTAG